MSEETTTAGDAGEKTFTQEQVNAFLAKELAPLREQIKTLQPAADELKTIKDSQKSEIEKLVEATKAESQKAIDEARKTAEEATTALEAFKRDTVLAKVPEDKREAFKDKSAAEIESAITLAAALIPQSAETPKIPIPLFGGGQSASGDETPANVTAARAAAFAQLRRL